MVRKGYKQSCNLPEKLPVTSPESTTKQVVVHAVPKMPLVKSTDNLIKETILLTDN